MRKNRNNLSRIVMHRVLAGLRDGDFLYQAEEFVRGVDIDSAESDSGKLYEEEEIQKAEIGLLDSDELNELGNRIDEESEENEENEESEERIRS